MKLSKNFTLNEFACKDGSKTLTIDYELIEKLQQLRDKVNKPVNITSGYRSVAYNKKCGGIATSNHLLGKAADIKISRMTPLEVAKLADTFGFLGIGVYPTFTHVDTQGSTNGRKIYWKQGADGVKHFVDSL
ncbi:MAG: D-Ala-D-Ala carboxypeptidase family metallohydrolase [Candidatus Paceibacterota bacterium]